MSEQNHGFSEVDTDLPFTDDGDHDGGIELSPALKNYDKIADDADPSEEKPDTKDVSKAEGVALGTLKAVEWVIDKWLGKNTGLVDADRKEWAAAVAPALVKMGVTDYTGFLDRYSVYITAIVATYTLGDKITKNVLQQLAEDAAAAEKQQQEQEAEQQAAQKVSMPGLDGAENSQDYGRDLATQSQLMAGQQHGN